jgi:hypothetical protein
MGWGHTQWPRVDGTFESAPVAIELVPRSDGVHTAVLTSLVAPLQGNVEVVREGLLAKIAKVFGAQDIALGDPAFDRVYLVKGTSEPTAHAVLSASAREEMLALGVDRLIYDDGSEHRHAALVFVEIPRVVEEPERLDRALRAVIDIARTRASTTVYR